MYDDIPYGGPIQLEHEWGELPDDMTDEDDDPEQM